VFEAGFGNDVLHLTNGPDMSNNAASETAVLRFAAGISAGDLQIDQVDGDLVIRIGQDSLRIADYNQRGGASLAFFFDDGTQLGAEQLATVAAFVGSNIHDTLFGSSANDVMRGLDGNDGLFAGTGDDTLIGGAGNDTLEGGAGADTYLYRRGDGSDWINNFASYTEDGSRDALVFEDLVAADVRVRRYSFDLIIEIAGTEDYLTLQRYFETDDISMSAVGQIRFSDGTIWTAEDVKPMVLVPSDGNDVLLGYGDSETIDAGAGDDSVYGGGGNDHVLGGDGDDWLGGDDQFMSVVDGGDDVIEGGAGNDRMFGGGGDDVLIGGAGNDEMQGDLGRNIYEFAPGFGHDRVLLDIFNVDSAAPVGQQGEVAVLRFGGGITAADVGITWVDGDPVLFVGNDRVAIIGYSRRGQARVEFEFADGSQLGLEQIRLLESLAGSGGDDALFGTREDDTLLGLGGNDVLIGVAGDDALVGGLGDDVYRVDASSGHDRLDNTGGGFDGIVFDEYVERNGESVSDPVTRSRVTFSRDGDDLLVQVDDGMLASTRVIGHFLGGENAIDFVEFSDGERMDTAAIDALFAPADPGTGDPGTGTGGGDIDTVDPGQFANVVDGSEAGEQLLGSNASDLIRGQGGDDSLFAFAGDDTLQGGDGNDQLYGGNGGFNGSGNDVLSGGAGDDTLFGEDGDDLLAGGAGNDVYFFNAASGADTIDNRGGGSDWIFMQNIARERISFIRDGDDLLVRVDDNAALHLRVLNHFLGGDNAIAFVQPGDGGALLDADAIAALLVTDSGTTDPGTGDPGTGDTGGGDIDTVDPGQFANVVDGSEAGEQVLGSNASDLIRGLGGDDTLFAFAGDDTLQGGDGNDQLYGGNGSFSNSGNDVLSGGVGDDMLVGEDGDDFLAGGAGSDTYFFNAASGADTIDNRGGGSDWIFMQNIARERISFIRDGDDLLVRVDDNAALQLRVLNHFLGGDNAITFVQPGDGGFAIPASDFADLLVPGATASGATTSASLSMKGTASNVDDAAALSGDGQWPVVQAALERMPTHIVPKVLTPVVIDGGDLGVSVPIVKPGIFQTPPIIPPSWPEDDALLMSAVLLVPERLVSDAVAPTVHVDPLLQTVDIGVPVLALDGGDLGVTLPIAKPVIFQTPPIIPPVVRDDGSHDLPQPPVVADAAPAPGEGLLSPAAPIVLPEFTLPSIDLDDLWTQLRLDGGNDGAPAPSPFDTPPLVVPHCQGASSLAHCNRLIELMAVNDGFAGDVAFHEHRFEARAQIFTP